MSSEIKSSKQTLNLETTLSNADATFVNIYDVKLIFN